MRHIDIEIYTHRMRERVHFEELQGAEVGVGEGSFPQPPQRRTHHAQSAEHVITEFICHTT